MSRVLILCPEPIRPVMAGMGIRCWEMARVLASDNHVTLGIPNDPAEAPSAGAVHLAAYDEGSTAALVRSADCVIVSGHASDPCFDCGVERPTVVDLYDPFPIENLNYFSELGREPYDRDRRTIERQLVRGDLFLCSSAEQRLFYLGMLFALGRLNPQAYDADATLRNLIRIVPFGVPAGAPPGATPVVRGIVPGIGSDDPIVLFGGVYDWHDPMTLLEALPALLARFPTLRVVFSENPHPESTPQGTLREVLDVCRSKGWLDSHVFVVPWVPYDERIGLYSESTVGVVLHRQRLETDVSMRTRVLDFLWAGLPVLATEGGGASELLRKHDMGRTVVAGDHEALTIALGEVLESSEMRERLAVNGRRWADENAWERILEPLQAYVAAPRADPHNDLYGARARGLQTGIRRRLQALMRRLGVRGGRGR